MPTSSGPLSDVRILAIEQYGAGPFGSLQLADLGADVIKIEDPKADGDIGRYVPPYQEGSNSLFFETFNRNKRAIDLDLSSPAGRAVFEDLVRRSDVVYSNLRGDVPEKLKIRYEDLAPINPAIVCCSLSGFGMTGPRAAQPGYDYLLQGMAGWMDVTGEPGGIPTRSGLSIVDFAGGYVAAISLLAALHAAQKTGKGSDCDVSLFDTAISLLTYLATWQLTSGYEPRRTRRSAHPSMVPFQIFETEDGWVVIACVKEKFWQRLLEAMNLKELGSDSRFESFLKRDEHREALLGILESRIREFETDTLLKMLNDADIPCARVNSIPEALQDDHTIAREMIVTTEHPQFGEVRQVASAVRVGPPGEDRPNYHRAPLRNENADDLLRDLLEYSPSRIEELRSNRAFG